MRTGAVVVVMLFSLTSLTIPLTVLSVIGSVPLGSHHGLGLVVVMTATLAAVVSVPENQLFFQTMFLKTC